MSCHWLVTKTTRSLSAVKRKSMITASCHGVSHDVIMALQAENDAVSHTHKPAQQLHPLVYYDHDSSNDNNSVYEPHPTESHVVSHAHNPAHLPSTPSTEKTIAIVTEQVKQMNCR